jgi:hypothetical protein
MIARIRARTLALGQSMVDWMEDRTGLVTIMEEFLYEPVPKRGRWLYTLGSSTLFLINLQFLTGILLLFYYVPTTNNAWDSIYYIMNDAYFGQLIRGIHFWSANILVVVIGLHMLRTFFSGAYKAPREMNWIVGVVLIFIVTILAFTGYALRWDAEGFWAWEVGIKIGSYSPFVGDYLAAFLLGGDTVGPRFWLLLSGFTCTCCASTANSGATSNTQSAWQSSGSAGRLRSTHHTWRKMDQWRKMDPRGGESERRVLSGEFGLLIRC